MTSDTIVRARIDSQTKEMASLALKGMGLSVSDAIRLLLKRIALEQAFPFDVKIPNAASRKALKELQQGKGEKFTSADELFKDLGI